MVASPCSELTKILGNMFFRHPSSHHVSFRNLKFLPSSILHSNVSSNHPSLTLFISQVIPCAIYMTPKLIKGFNLLKKLSVSIYLHLFPFALAFPFSCFTYACYRWKTIPIKDIVAGSTSIGFSIPAFVFTTGTSLIIDFVPTLPCKQHALLLNI